MAIKWNKTNLPTHTERARIAEEQKRKEQSPQIASILFVTMVEKGDIDSVTAAEHVEQFEVWNCPINYTDGQIRRYGDTLYKCIQAHTSQTDWTPDKTPAMWKPISDPSEEWPQWSQPIGAMDSYKKGDKVSHNDEHWVSDVDNNVWEPGVYGWTISE